MPEKSWKVLERRVATKFGCHRTPLSGGNGRQTRSDTLHEKLFIEVKQRATHTVATLYREVKAAAEKEGKTPLLALQEKGKHGCLYVIHEQDFWELVRQTAEAQKHKPSLTGNRLAPLVRQTRLVRSPKRGERREIRS